MSAGNREYLLRNHRYIQPEQVFVNYNWAEDKPTSIQARNAILAKHGYKEDDIICVFGGNFGRPQAIDNLAFLAKNLPNIHFIFVGKGTEYGRLSKLVGMLTNVKID